MSSYPERTCDTETQLRFEAFPIERTEGDLRESLGVHLVPIRGAHTLGHTGGAIDVQSAIPLEEPLVL